MTTIQSFWRTMTEPDDARLETADRRKEDTMTKDRQGKPVSSTEMPKAKYKLRMAAHRATLRFWTNRHQAQAARTMDELYWKQQKGPLD